MIDIRHFYESQLKLENVLVIQRCILAFCDSVEDNTLESRVCLMTHDICKHHSSKSAN
jgi:hypothetical protein